MPGGRVYEFRPARYGAGPDLQRHGARGEHELQLPGTGDGRGGEPERVLECGERGDAGDAGGAGGSVRVQRGERDDGRGRLGEQQRRDGERGDVDDGGAVRERAGVRWDERERHGGELGVAAVDGGDDAGGMGVPDGGADGVAGGDRQERGRVLPDGVVVTEQPAGGRGDVYGGEPEHRGGGGGWGGPPGAPRGGRSPGGAAGAAGRGGGGGGGRDS